VFCDVVELGRAGRACGAGRRTVDLLIADDQEAGGDELRREGAVCIGLEERDPPATVFGARGPPRTIP